MLELKLEKKQKSKKGGGGICAPRAQRGRVPVILRKINFDIIP